MFGKTKNQNCNVFKWLFAILAIFFSIGFFIAMAYFILEKQYTGRIYPGIKIGNLDLSGMTTNQAINFLNQKVDNINQNGIIFTYDYFQATLHPVISSVESDLAYQIIIFDVENTVNKAMDFGRTNNIKNDIFARINTYLNGHNILFINTVHEAEIDKFLHTNFDRFETPAENANLKLDESGEFIVTEEKYGQILDYITAKNTLIDHLNKLKLEDIILQAKIEQPIVFKKDVLNIDSKAKTILAKTPIKLTHNDNNWTINKKTLSPWLILKTNKLNDTNKTYIGIDYEKFIDYATSTISKDIDIEPIDAKFEVKDGKVIEFQVSKDGQKVDTLETAKKFETTILNTDEEETKIVVQTLKSTLQTESINDLGIKEILGTGHSDFSGSPANRRHNINTGADAVNGVIVKPGEEFSLIDTLGDINAETGYKAELVIKDNKTIPEFGGGLCQIGTTIFRATYNTGLPVTMRRNHSYRVSYYEPAGTDATIYDPWPDYRFKNDTKHHILIQARIEGDDLYFDFWGTNDGRIATHTEPTIYNIKKPQPAKMIETLDLEPGVKKCSELAHNGADAYFDYSITYSKDNPPEDYDEHDSEASLVRDTRFSSHYVPWRAVCLIGVEKLSEPDGATTTEAVLNE